MKLYHIYTDGFECVVAHNTALGALSLFKKWRVGLAYSVYEIITPSKPGSVIEMFVMEESA